MPDVRARRHPAPGRHLRRATDHPERPLVGARSSDAATVANRCRGPNVSSAAIVVRSFWLEAGIRGTRALWVKAMRSPVPTATDTPRVRPRARRRASAHGACERSIGSGERAETGGSSGPSAIGAGGVTAGADGGRGSDGWTDLAFPTSTTVPPQPEAVTHARSAKQTATRHARGIPRAAPTHERRAAGSRCCGWAAIRRCVRRREPTRSVVPAGHDLPQVRDFVGRWDRQFDVDVVLRDLHVHPHGERCQRRRRMPPC